MLFPDCSIIKRFIERRDNEIDRLNDQIKQLKEEKAKPTEDNEHLRAMLKPMETVQKTLLIKTAPKMLIIRPLPRLKSRGLGLAIRVLGVKFPTFSRWK